MAPHKIFFTALFGQASMLQAPKNTITCKSNTVLESEQSVKLNVKNTIIFHQGDIYHLYMFVIFGFILLINPFLEGMCQIGTNLSRLGDTGRFLSPLHCVSLFHLCWDRTAHNNIHCSTQKATVPKFSEIVIWHV